MPAPANTYILQHIYANIPRQILAEAFEPMKYQVSLDERILGEVIATRVLLDTNLVAGRMTQILLQSEWIKDTQDGIWDALTATQYNSCFFWVPPEYRENRNIAALVRILDSSQQLLPSDGSVAAYSNYGNTVSALANAAVASRTLAGAADMPRATLEGNNFVKVYGNYPNTYFGGLTLECVLEFDTEFNNADQNLLYHLRELALCATKAWIWNKLVIQIDSAEISAGMQIGVFKDIVSSYATANDEYHDKLMYVRGAAIMDENTLADFIYMQL